MVSLKVKEILCLLYSVLLFISGVLLISFSVLLCYQLFYHFKFIPSSAIGPFILFFLLGFGHLFLTWLGVKGPTREHDFHLILFMVITAALLVAECAIAIWSIILWDETDIESIQLMTVSFDEYIKNASNRKEWAKLETKLHCCGLNGVGEYREIKEAIPISCCKSEYHNNTCSFYEVGCKLPLTRYVKSVLIDGTIMGFTCTVLQGLGLFAFITFFRALKEERTARIQRRLALQRRVSQENGPPSLPTAPPTA